MSSVNDAPMEPWRSAITNSDDQHIWIQGYDVAHLMASATFADVVFLLHKGRLPSDAERRIVDAMLIAVADHGPGFSPAEIKKLFRPFSKSAREAANSAPGVGLGLALSRRLARQMKGDLKLQDSNGGASFVLTLPLA